eukprot:snap_masked-scaffold_41-processed-gene-2.63-mRNA-1 protein AED:1.00 eAED:1.00 QI:0/0/0/0/1/1/2/0/1000
MKRNKDGLPIAHRFQQNSSEDIYSSESELLAKKLQLLVAARKRVKNINLFQIDHENKGSVFSFDSFWGNLLKEMKQTSHCVGSQKQTCNILNQRIKKEIKYKAKIFSVSRKRRRILKKFAENTKIKGMDSMLAVLEYIRNLPVQQLLSSAIEKFPKQNGNNKLSKVRNQETLKKSDKIVPVGLNAGLNGSVHLNGVSNDQKEISLSMNKVNKVEGIATNTEVKPGVSSELSVHQNVNQESLSEAIKRIPLGTYRSFAVAAYFMKHRYNFAIDFSSPKAALGFLSKCLSLHRKLILLSEKAAVGLKPILFLVSEADKYTWLSHLSRVSSNFEPRLVQELCDRALTSAKDQLLIVTKEVWLNTKNSNLLPLFSLVVVDLWTDVRTSQLMQYFNLFESSFVDANLLLCMLLSKRVLGSKGVNVENVVGASVPHFQELLENAFISPSVEDGSLNSKSKLQKEIVVTENSLGDARISVKAPLSSKLPEHPSKLTVSFAKKRYMKPNAFDNLSRWKKDVTEGLKVRTVTKTVTAKDAVNVSAPLYQSMASRIEHSNVQHNFRLSVTEQSFRPTTRRLSKLSNLSYSIFKYSGFELAKVPLELLEVKEKNYLKRSAVNSAEILQLNPSKYEAYKVMPPEQMAFSVESKTIFVYLEANGYPFLTNSNSCLSIIRTARDVINFMYAVSQRSALIDMDLLLHLSEKDEYRLKLSLESFSGGIQIVFTTAALPANFLVQLKSLFSSRAIVVFKKLIYDKPKILGLPPMQPNSLIDWTIASKSHKQKLIGVLTENSMVNRISTERNFSTTLPGIPSLFFAIRSIPPAGGKLRRWFQTEKTFSSSSGLHLKSNSNVKIVHKALEQTMKKKLAPGNLRALHYSIKKHFTVDAIELDEEFLEFPLPKEEGRCFSFKSKAPKSCIQRLKSLSQKSLDNARARMENRFGTTAVPPGQTLRIVEEGHFALNQSQILLEANVHKKLIPNLTPGSVFQRICEKSIKLRKTKTETLKTSNR